MCGYADIYERGQFFPISSMYYRVDSEKQNVNFAIIYGVVEWFSPFVSKGCYLCDEARNVLHETNFQDFLAKYFGFRRAYCKIYLLYRPGVNIIVSMLFPFRKIFLKIHRLNMVRSVLKMEVWKRGLPE